MDKEKLSKISVSDVGIDMNKDDYISVMKEFGIGQIDEPLKKLSKIKKLSILYRRGAVIGHRDFDRIYDAIKNRKKFAVLTGFNPSGSIHFGNKMFLDQALFLQQCGADVFIPISNDETYYFGKTNDLDKTTAFAKEIVIPNIIALGFKPGKTKIFISTEYPKVYGLAVKLSTKTTFSSIKAIFGFSNETSPGRIFYGIVQSAHILIPQIKEFNGPSPVVVPVGIDQDPYMRLVRDIAERMGFVKPSSTYHVFMRGLHGGKMSGSKPQECIFLDDKPAEAAKKMMGAKTGGRGSAEEQRRLGADPDVCSVFEYYKYHLADTDTYLARVEKECRTGKRLCGRCKQECAKLLVKFLKQHQQKVNKARKQVKKFMIID